MIIAGSAIILAAIDRFPIIVWAGAALLGYVAGEMLLGDVAIVEHFGEETLHAWETPVALGCAAGVVGLAWVIGRLKTKKVAEAHGNA
jgi:predicted tellurium resistance membrane protein TerC